MSAWRYQIIRTEERDGDGDFAGFHYTVHEVYLDGGGVPVGATVKPVTFGAESPGAACEALALAERDCSRFPVLEIVTDEDGTERLVEVERG